MIADITAARREMFALLAAADFSTSPIAPSIVYEGRVLPLSGDKSPDGAYVEIFMRHANDPQSALAGDTSVRLWDGLGTLWIRCFGPLSSGQGFEISEKLATISKLAYRGKSTPNGIWFRNARINNLGVKDSWYLMNVLVDYEYHELG